MSAASSDSDRVYLATPPGRGGIAVIVVRGPGAVARVEPLLRSRHDAALGNLPEGRLLCGHIVEGETVLDEVLVRVERHGHETSVEIDCHGGPVPCEAIIAALCRRGAVRTDWEAALAHEPELGPISREAMRLLPRAITVRTAAALMDQYTGALARSVRLIVEQVGRGDTPSASESLRSLLATANTGLHLTEPWRVVVAGRPNVGKSTLVNALVGATRSIVSSEPGTTRDVLGQEIAVDGWPVCLTDTAGLHQTDDPIDRAAVVLAREAVAHADLLLLVLDGSCPLQPADEDLLQTAWSAPVLKLVNKIDLPPAWPSTSVDPDLCISALRGEGIDLLCDRIATRLVPHPPSRGDALVFTAQQQQMLARAHVDLSDGRSDDALAALRDMLC